MARYARDSQGRVRTEKAHKVKLLTTAIFDPVAGCAYLLDEDSKIAHRMKLPAAGPSAPSEDNLEIGVVRGFRMATLSRAEPVVGRSGVDRCRKQCSVRSAATRRSANGS